MSPSMGEYALSGAMLTSLAVVFAVVAAWRMENPAALRAARWGMVLMCGLLTAAAWALLAALLGDDFSVAYVAEHSEKALPTGYKLAAFWASQGGGLLLWAWAMAVMGAIMTFRLRKRDDMEAGVALAMMAAVVGFFVAVILFAGSAESPANPLEPMGPMGQWSEDMRGALTGRGLVNDNGTVRDGLGLNPALQNIAMVVHPPMLFLGYAGFAAPFALLMGALVTGKLGRKAMRPTSGFEVVGVKYPEERGQRQVGAAPASPAFDWLREARPWMMWGWIALTVGIVLGCWWAYTELGWGGYWAWDPVENASLLPWLTGTALLHSAVMQTKRGSFRGWTAVLTVVSFLLCIFGTYLTRSGIKSVHSFAASAIPLFFLWMMAIVVVGATALLIIRRKQLVSDEPLDDMISREGFFLLGNVLLVTMAAVTALATSLPIIIGGLHLPMEPIEVKAEFYNRVILPMALVLAGLMATGPVLGHGAGAAGRAKKQLLAMAAVGVVAAVLTAVLGFVTIWAMAAAAVVAAVIAGVIMDFAGAVTALQGTGAGAAEAGAKAIRRGLRHWGAQVAHLGLAAMVAGIAGSSLYQWKNDFTALEKGRPQTFDGVTVTYQGMVESDRRTYHVLVGTVEVADTTGRREVLHPEVHFYNQKPQQPVFKVALGLGLGKDVYVRLLGTDESEKWAIQVIRNPLVNWIWIGGIMLTLGGLICLIPGRAAPVVEAAQKTQNGDRRGRKMKTV